MTTNTEPQLKEELDKALEAPQGTGSKIKVSLGEDIDFVYEVKPDESPGQGKTVVAYTAYQEERQEPFKITLKGLMKILDESMADLLPEGLQEQSINFKNLMVIYRKETPKSQKAQWLFALDLNIATKLKLKSLPVVGDLIPKQIAEEEIVPFLRIIAASKAFSIKEFRFLNDKIPSDITPLPVPKKEGTEESEAKRSVRKGFSFSGQLGLPDTSSACELTSKSTSRRRRRRTRTSTSTRGRISSGWRRRRSYQQ